MNTSIRLGASAAAGLGAAILVAVVVAIADLYLTGHGYGSLTREVVSWDPGGVHLSVGDVILVVTVMVVLGAV